MSGYVYGQPEPKERCPYCRALCCADWVDVGIGFVQCGPFHCESCHASEIGTFDDKRNLSPTEEYLGWYAPNTPPGSTANTDPLNPTRIIQYHEADTLYRAEHGVAPRYDRQGNPR